jgi:hypothetical protein
MATSDTHGGIVGQGEEDVMGCDRRRWCGFLYVVLYDPAYSVLLALNVVALLALIVVAIWKLT